MTPPIVAEMIAAHGGMDAWGRARSVSFDFLSKLPGAPTPWLSHETVEPRTGRAYLEWPLLGATTGFDGTEAWSVNWSGPLPPGFFSRLTYSFLMLPWLTQRPEVRLGDEARGRIPGDTTNYVTVRMTHERPSPSMPGDYYDLYIHPETHRLIAVGFNITHPGMVATPGQPIGPLWHVFSDYVEADGLLIPVYYETYTVGPDGAPRRGAIHLAWNVSLTRAFDASRTRRSAEALADTLTMRWWGTTSRN